MSLTTPAEEITSAAPASDEPDLFDLAVNAIMKETGRPRHEAVEGLQFIFSMADKARRGARCKTVGTHHLDDEEMESLGYAVMDQVMEHGSEADEGSAHAAIQRAVLQPNEFALMHDNPSGKREDCVVTVDILSA